MTAIWTAPRTWADNDLVAAADLNEQLRDNLEFLGVLLVKDSLIIIEDQKTSGTHGGTFTAGSWQTRDLNTVVTDAGGYASLSSNQITLAAGTYEARITVPAYLCYAHKARLQNITDSTTTLVGTSERLGNTAGVMSKSFIIGRFTIASSKVFEVQHQCGLTQTSYGFGYAGGFDTEVYTTVELIRIDD